MTEFTSVAGAGDIPAGELAAFEVSGERIAIANVEGSFFAFGDTCTHARCSLAGGELEGRTVTCPCHGSEFDVGSGEVLNPPATEPVRVYEVRVENDVVQVQF